MVKTTTTKDNVKNKTRNIKSKDPKGKLKNLVKLERQFKGTM